VSTRLADQEWRRVNVHTVHHAFARAEWQKLPLARPEERHLIDAPNLNNADENRRRREILYSLRKPLFDKVPSNTEWYEVEYLERAHLDQLLVIGRCDWDDATDKNELLKVAGRKKYALEKPPAEWAEPVLWGHSKAGPFTILEGNHRLVAYAGAPSPPELKIAVYIGLSRDRCFWHLRDKLT
jgi:hypothetical protein